MNADLPGVHLPSGSGNADVSISMEGDVEADDVKIDMDGDVDKVSSGMCTETLIVY